MSRTVVGYTGEGRARRPVYEDQGPASAWVGTEPAGPGDSDSPVLVSVGAGPVERRMVSDAQRATWAAQAAEARPKLASSHPASHPVRQRPAARPLERAIKALDRRQFEEELADAEPFVVPTTFTPTEHPTLEEEEHLVGNDVDPLAVPVRPAVPATFEDLWFELIEPGCDHCLHAVVCSIRPTIPDAVQAVLESAALPTGIRPAYVRTLDLSCDHFLESASGEPDPAPIVVPAAPPAEPRPGSRYSRSRHGVRMEPKPANGKLSPREAALIEGIRQAGRILPGASAAGIARGSAHGIVLQIRARGLLPADVEQILATHSRPARRA